MPALWPAIVKMGLFPIAAAFAVGSAQAESGIEPIPRQPSKQPSASEAQPSPPESEQARQSLRLAPIDVKGDSSPTEAGRENRAYPSTDVRRETIEALPGQRVGDILGQMPGVSMGGSPGDRNDVRLRGLDKEFTRTQFDGVLLSDGGEKREFQTGRFPAFLVEDIEIIRNPTPEYEGDGIAGRIDIGLRQIPTERLIEIQGGIGSPLGRENEFLAGYGERFDGFGFQAGLSHNRNPIDKKKAKFSLGGTTEDELEEKQQDFDDLIADLGFFGDRHELHIKPIVLNLADHKRKRKDTRKTDGSLDKIDFETADELKRTAALVTKHHFAASPALLIDTDLVMTATWEDKEADRTFLKNGGTAVDKFEYETEDKQDAAAEIGSKVTLPGLLGPSHELKLGIASRYRERYRDKTKIEDKAGVVSDKTVPKDAYDLSEGFFGSFIQDQVQLTDAWSLTGGIRFEHVVQKPSAGDGSAERASFTDVMPGLHLTYDPAGPVIARASVSRQVNRPKFDELSPYQQAKGSDLVEGNSQLAPARS